MESLQIQKIIENDQQSRDIFGGLLAFDELPKKVKWPSCYIINTDIRSKPGTHSSIPLFPNASFKSSRSYVSEM